MRQAGFVPKSHDSGVYWVRANASNAKKENNSVDNYSGSQILVMAFCFVLFYLLVFWFINYE